MKMNLMLFRSTRENGEMINIRPSEGSPPWSGDDRKNSPTDERR
jgi:hypothetical protein